MRDMKSTIGKNSRKHFGQFLSIINLGLTSTSYQGKYQKILTRGFITFKVILLWMNLNFR